MRKLIFIYALSMLMGANALAQAPANDECLTATPLADVTNFCSPSAGFTNVGATPSNLSAPGCFGSVQDDVWFTFTPTATDVTITVRGATIDAPGGTLQDPQIALYFGNCVPAGTSELECQSATGNDNIAEAYQGGLFIGSTYLIRIQGAGGQNGTFQLCINNYNPPVEPTSDCPTAAILCDKSPFVVQSVVGAGSNNLEMQDAVCFDNGVPGLKEMNSTWFVWTCSQSGSLTFTLTPLNAPDDLDFVLYRLPNGIGNCNGKVVERCMASGLSQGQGFPSPCLGPTGLRDGDTDTDEDAGCSEAGDNAWLSPFNMVQGVSYALVVNNFSETGNGFSIEFGGSGKFLGPEAKFETIPSAVCLGTAVQVIDASTFTLGAITNWNWSFGADAIPQTATGPGPHTVQFNSPGSRGVVLTLETDLGCKVTDIQPVLIYPDVKVDTLIAAPDCNGTANGSVQINNITSGTPPYMFSWNSGPFSTNNSLQNLGVGVYTLKIKDFNNCETDLSIDVKERILTAVPEVINPLCFGESNGVITLNVTNGKDPVLFDWGAGFIPLNTQSTFAAGTYTIQAIDDALCKGTFSVFVGNNPALTLLLDASDITCFGAMDASATAIPGGGVGNFSYDWSDGQTTVTAAGLDSGTYTVIVSDANDCTITTTTAFVEPPDVGINLIDVLDLLCNGIPEGEIRVEGIGGRPPYTFSANGFNYVPTDTLRGLPAGDYWVNVLDASGCKDSVMAMISQPLPVVVQASPADTTILLGYSFDVSTITGPSNRIFEYLWTPSLGVSDVTVAEPSIQGIETIAYIIKATDEDGCMGFDTVRVRVKKDRPVYFPNVFDPESVNFNDFFTGFGGPSAKSIELLRIYDRWGTLVFETKDIDLGVPQLGWNGTFRGKPVDGVFAWYAKVKFIDNEVLQFEGDITVVR